MQRGDRHPHPVRVKPSGGRLNPRPLVRVAAAYGAPIVDAQKFTWGRPKGWATHQRGREGEGETCSAQEAGGRDVQGSGSWRDRRAGLRKLL
eukprot:424618-Prymnesium_polylepis.1